MQPCTKKHIKHSLEGGRRKLPSFFCASQKAERLKRPKKSLQAILTLSWIRTQEGIKTSVQAKNLSRNGCRKQKESRHESGGASFPCWPSFECAENAICDKSNDAEQAVKTIVIFSQVGINKKRKPIKSSFHRNGIIWVYFQVAKSWYNSLLRKYLVYIIRVNRSCHYNTIEKAINLFSKRLAEP